MRLSRYLPILDWGRTYRRETLISDLMAALIVTIMLIPQSLAYAMLAGMPPETGLYASMAPLVLYAIFGTGRTLAVGPVAVISLMTAVAVGRVADEGSMGYVTAALTLAVLSGVILMAMGLFRLGFVANFLSHPVISGFITASGLLIAAGQMKHVLGTSAGGHTGVEIAASLVSTIGEANLYTLAVAVPALLFLYWARKGAQPLLRRLGLGPFLAGLIARAAPVLSVAFSILAVKFLDLSARGVATVGDIPAGLPPFTLPSVDPSLISALIGPALLLSAVGFVESVSVAQTLAAKRRQRIDPDQELIGLGAANIGSGLSGGFPVTGGFARSVVNFDAGAETPAAGAFTAIGIALASLFLTPLLSDLPVAVLAATIIVAVLSLADFPAIRRTWTYSKSDGAAMIGTILATLLVGVEAGILTGVTLSIGLHLYKTSRPHSAVVGLVPGTEHFRNIDRHAVTLSPALITLRVDESLYFPNARYLEDRVLELVAAQPEAKHFVLMCPAINAIDASALESLEVINQRLKEAGLSFNLSEVKGPVMDRLKRSGFLDHLNGKVYLSQYEAFRELGG
ncbi:MAG: SulP family inorganic anion transporter [Caulobacterales bacterium]|uniref:SulP family inorganic anion transporter n=1 Tax=Glycocaulis sp. TaxID=1969725 RepID=UPI003FA11C17